MSQTYYGGPQPLQSPSPISLQKQSILPRWLIPTVIALLSVFLLAPGISIPLVGSMQYQQGYAQGHTQGYNQGKIDSYQQGKNDGYQQGKADGTSTGYSNGQSDENALWQRWFNQNCWSSLYYPNGSNYPASASGYFCQGAHP